MSSTSKGALGVLAFLAPDQPRAEQHVDEGLPRLVGGCDEEVLEDGQPTELARELERPHEAEPRDLVARPVGDLGLADELPAAVAASSRRRGC